MVTVFHVETSYENRLTALLAGRAVCQKVSLIDLCGIEERKGAAITGWRVFDGRAKNARILAGFLTKSSKKLG
jgi:hypothetical protein